MNGIVLDDGQIEVVVAHDPDEEITTSHFFPGYDDPKMVRAINELNENQLIYTKRGRPQENSGPAGQKFYNQMCLHCARIYVRGKDGKPQELTPETEGWKKKVPAHIKTAAAAAFIARRGNIQTGN